MQEKVKTYFPHRPHIVTVRELRKMPNLIKLTAIFTGLVLLLYFNYAQAADVNKEQFFTSSRMFFLSP
jgi:hypothetical protein